MTEGEATATGTAATMTPMAVPSTSCALGMLVATVGGLAVLLSAALPTSAHAGDAPVETLSVDERGVLEVVLLTPFPDASLGVGRIVEHLDAMLRARTTLRAVDRARDPRDLVGSNLARVVRVVRADVDPAAVAARPDRFDAATYVEAKRTTEAVLILALTVVGQGESTRIVPAVVQVAPALDALVSVQRGASSAESSEQRLQREQLALLDAGAVVRPESFSVRVGQEGDLRAGLDRLLTNDLRGLLEQMGAWEQLGRIRLRANVPGAEIRLDDALLGRTREGDVVLADVAPSVRRRVSVTLPGSDVVAREVEVRPGAEAFLEVELSRRTEGVAQSLTLWSGVGALALGAAFSAAAAAAPQTAGTCITRDGQCGVAWKRFGRSTDGAALVTTADYAGQGPALLPLGYSLGLTGAIWLSSALWLDDEVPAWVPLVVGVAAGALSYTVSELAMPGLAPGTVFRSK
jgi:hypothetical protein